MNDSMDKITTLDSCRKEKFRRPAHRLIEAKEIQHRSYHERPIQRDMFAEYDAIAAWGTVTCCYSGIEQAMKCLLQMRGTYVDKPFAHGGHKHHNIGTLFQYLASEEQDVLRVSYGIYRSLHDYIPPETVDCFLEAIDNGYPTWRYFLLEGKMPPTTHSGAMLEIWSTLTDILQARVFTNHGLNPVEQRIDHHLDWVDHIYETGAGQRERDDIIRWMRKSHKNVPMNACADLFYHHAESSLDLIEVLPSTKEVLRTMVDILKDTWVDNDFDYFLRRARVGEIVWNPDKNLFEKILRVEEIEIKLIESDHSYFEDSILGPSMKADFVESVPDYIEDFIFEPRVEGEFADDDWSVEDEVWKARIEYYEKRKAETREYEGGIGCEGYRCNINGTALVIVLYDSKEWIVYRYHNASVPGIPHHCKHINGDSVRSGRQSEQLSIGGEQKRRSLKHFVNQCGIAGERGEVGLDGKMEVNER